MMDTADAVCTAGSSKWRLASTHDRAGLLKPASNATAVATGWPVRSATRARPYPNQKPTAWKSATGAIADVHISLI